MKFPYLDISKASLSAFSPIKLTGGTPPVAITDTMIRNNNTSSVSIAQDR